MRLLDAFWVVWARFSGWAYGAHQSCVKISLMLKKLPLGKKSLWVHLVQPKDAEIKALKDQFNVHPIILDELLSPSDRSKIENYGDYIFLVYHLPIYDTASRTSRRGEIDFIVTKKAIITVAYENLEPFLQFERDLEVRLKNKILGTPEALYYILEEINAFSLRQLKHVEKKVNFVGDKLFKRQDRRLLEEISYIKRDILDFAIIAAPQRTNLESLEGVIMGIWGKEYRVYFSDLVGDFLKISYLLENLKATVDSYSETVSQIFEFKTSEVIRRFSILGFLGFPLILWATILLQPKIDHSLVKSPADYWLQIGIVAAIVVGLALIFRKKGWL